MSLVLLFNQPASSGPPPAPVEVAEPFGGVWRRMAWARANASRQVQDEIEEVIEQAAQQEAPKPVVAKQVRQVLKANDVKQAYVKAYVEAYLEMYSIRLKEQEEEDEAISILLMH